MSGGGGKGGKRERFDARHLVSSAGERLPVFGWANLNEGVSCVSEGHQVLLFDSLYVGGREV